MSTDASDATNIDADEHQFDEHQHDHEFDETEFDETELDETEFDETEFDETVVDDAREALEESRRRLAEVPTEVVVVNHVMGLYELAAIHLGATPPALPQAALAIDAVGCLVEGLGERLGPDAATLRDALANIRLAFVQIKGSVE